MIDYVDPPATDWRILVKSNRFSVVSSHRDRRGKIVDSTVKEHDLFFLQPRRKRKRNPKACLENI